MYGFQNLAIGKGRMALLLSLKSKLGFYPQTICGISSTRKNRTGGGCRPQKETTTMINFKTTSDEMLAVQLDRTVDELNELEAEAHDAISAEFLEDHGDLIDTLAAMQGGN